jgi:two-component system, response regulator / RNA-binding antiterminator
VKGLAQDRVRPVVDVAVAHFNRYHAMREELDRARLSLVERKTVDRAKGLLMEQKALSEEAAYKVLRKLAMDQNKRIGEVAREIVTYAKVLKP